MNLAQQHLLLNHWPILGTIIALALFIVALMGNRDALKQASLALFVLMALVAIPTFMTGYAAQEAIKDSADISMDLIKTHQGSALFAFFFMEMTGVASLFGLWRFSRTAKNPFSARPGRMMLSVVFVLAAATCFLMAVTGNTGGQINHPEILSYSAVTSAIGSAGSSITPLFQHYVIDWSMWVWPILEDLHFLGLILLLGGVGILNLRILGFLKRLPLAPLHRFLPWGIAGFAINVITGFLFFMGMPAFYVVNVVFQIKLLTILLAGTNLIVFQCTSVFLSLEEVGPGEDAPKYAKVIAVASIFLWIAVIVLGRYIPYGEVT